MKLDVFGLDKLKKLNRFNPIAVSEQVVTYLPQGLPREGVRRRVLDVILNIGIPFNRWLGLKIKEFGPTQVVVESPDTVLRRNHVGTAHACALALIGEYPSGLLVAQRYSFDKYRIIISKLEMEYMKAGKGTLFGAAQAPMEWPEQGEEETWVEMETKITNKKGDLVAVCKTKWQIKEWSKVKSVN